MQHLQKVLGPEKEDIRKYLRSGQPHNHDFLFLRMSKHPYQEKVMNDQTFTMIVYRNREGEHGSQGTIVAPR